MEVEDACDTDTFFQGLIEPLVVLVAVMFLVMFIMDIYRCRRRASVISIVMKTAHGMSDRIVVFLIGAMQSARFKNGSSKNDLFPVWAVVLASLQGSLGYLSGYSILDREQRFTEVTSVMKYIGSGVLNGTRPLPFTKPLWSLWAIIAARSLYRFLSHTLAIKSVWNARSSEFLPEYLRQQRTGEGSSSGIQYAVPVYGESKQKVRIQKPQYILHLDITDPGSFITLDKIFGSCELLPAHGGNRCRYEDVCLAFSLSRLLRCKLEDVPLHSNSIGRIQNLVISKIIRYHQVDAQLQQQATGSCPACSTEEEKEKAAGQAFRILELELAFLRDYFYTLYPMVFWRGLFSLCISLLMSIATIGVTVWLAVRIFQVYDVPIKDYLTFWKSGCHFDLFITWVFMLFMVLKELWEMFTYLVSNWTRLLLVCKYVQNRCWCLWSAGLTKGLTGSFFTSEIVSPWHGRIGQYHFLQSYTYKATFWRMAHTTTAGKSPQKFEGKKSGKAIKISDCVKEAILRELCRLEPTSHQLPRDIPSLTNPELFNRYKWAWFKFSKCSQSVLVWHIATSLCEIKLAQDNKQDCKPSCQCSVWSWLKRRFCCSSQPFLVDENISLERELRNNYHIANSLSRYCAYLLAFEFELLPDSFRVPEVIFNKTIVHACNDLRGCDCDSPVGRYQTLMNLVKDVETEHEKLRLNIVRQGAVLAKDLISESEKDRWEILAAAWTKLLVYIAPSWNAEAHKSSLGSGGELITVIWALLWHRGIEKGSLWYEDRAPETTAEAHQEDDTNVQPYMRNMGARRTLQSLISTESTLANSQDLEMGSTTIRG